MPGSVYSNPNPNGNYDGMNITDIYGLTAKKSTPASNTPTSLSGFDSGNFKGDFYGFLGNYIKSILNDGMPFMDEYRQQMQGTVNKSFDNSRQSLLENFAGRGTYGSGMMAGALGNLAGQRANALNQGELGLQSQNTQYQQNALAKLLGLNQFGAAQDFGEASNNREYEYKKWMAQIMEKQFQQQMDAQPSEFWSLFGNILGGGAQVGTAALLGGGK